MSDDRMKKEYTVAETRALVGGEGTRLTTYENFHSLDSAELVAVRCSVDGWMWVDGKPIRRWFFFAEGDYLREKYLRAFSPRYVLCAEHAYRLSKKLLNLSNRLDSEIRSVQKTLHRLHREESIVLASSDPPWRWRVLSVIRSADRGVEFEDMGRWADESEKVSDLERLAICAFSNTEVGLLAKKLLRLKKQRNRVWNLEQQVAPLLNAQVCAEAEKTPHSDQSRLVVVRIQDEDYYVLISQHADRFATQATTILCVIPARVPVPVLTVGEG